MRRTFACLILSLLALAGCNSEPDARTKTLHLAKIVVRHAWIQLPAVAGRPAAGYFSIHTRVPATLDGISSPSAEHIEMHETQMDGNVAKMTTLTSVHFDAKETLTFAPTAKHAMLFGLSPTVKAGKTIELTFLFRDVPPVTVDADVRAAGDGN